ncbi:MAG: prepilin peptidase [Cyanobacteria bacterium QS_5_48_63]|jgi:leader peptidase (prepilin peptidase)/N-methyltransferase|nr:MAG: prepilin peptidase [Cyanobacteria bacterium QS_5_48_63]
MIVVIAALIVFALGASIGSFLNVVIYRLPAGMSILRPPSRCPVCSHKLGKSENVPILGWLWLRGRCRHCRTRISIRYPLVESVGGLLFLLVFWQFGVSIQTLGYWAFLGWLLALSLIDWETMTLPNALTQSSLAVGLGVQATAGWQETAQLMGVSTQLMVGIGGAALGIWLFDGIAFVGSLAFGQAAMGGGDAKLAAAIGAWLGWKHLLLASLLACAMGALIGGAVIALGWLNRRQPMPFGPFLALGAGLTVFFGEAILSTYLKLFFPLN